MEHLVCLVSLYRYVTFFQFFLLKRRNSQDSCVISLRKEYESYSGTHRNTQDPNTLHPQDMCSMPEQGNEQIARIPTLEKGLEAMSSGLYTIGLSPTIYTTKDRLGLALLRT